LPGASEKLPQIVLCARRVLAKGGAGGEYPQLRMIGVESETVIKNAKDVADFRARRSAVGVKLVYDQMKDIRRITAEPLARQIKNRRLYISLDLIRLGLSLASAARGSDLPGITTAKMLERMMAGYEESFAPGFNEETDIKEPKAIQLVSKQAAAASWETLAKERIEDIRPTLPLRRRFWPITKSEKREVEKLFQSEELRRLATMLRSRRDDARVELLDAAYWMKGCSSLGRLRYAVILRIGGRKGKNSDYCIMDIKEATPAAAPRSPGAKISANPAERVVEGARNLSPHLGTRMRASQLLNKPVFVRELMPQDLKIEIERLSPGEATKTAYFLSAVVGKAHSRQMDRNTRMKWLKDLQHKRSKSLDAPSWLWLRS
jgi:uncharacterized protein (DUF2252 family)